MRGIYARGPIVIERSRMYSAPWVFFVSAVCFDLVELGTDAKIGPVNHDPNIRRLDRWNIFASNAIGQPRRFGLKGKHDLPVRTCDARFAFYDCSLARDP